MEKYYLSEKAIGRLVKKSNKIIRKPYNPDVSSCLVANYYKMGARDQQYIKDDNVKRITGLFDEDKKQHQAGSIYDTTGISPTLTGVSGGHVQPYILINEGTKKGYSEAEEGDSINLSYPNNTNKRGRIGKQVSQTILANNNIATLEETDKLICVNNQNGKTSYNERIYDTEGIMPTLTAGNYKPNILEKNNVNLNKAFFISEDKKHCFRIRKLTPKECWRLMRIF